MNGAGPQAFPIFTNEVFDPTQVTLTATISTPTGPITSTASLTLLPSGFQVNVADLGPRKQCQANAGAPINLTNGNVWIQQRDYSLPGLGGGLELVRTWNSRWQDSGPIALAGMFGNSWMSTYEEQLSFPSSNTIQYGRRDGSAWTFSFDSATNTYFVSSPPDERATIQFSTLTTQYTLVFADGSQKIFSQAGYLANLLDRNGNQTTIARDSSNRVTQVTDAAGRSISFGYNDSVNTSQATSVQDSVGTIATYTYDSSAQLTKVAYADGSSLNFAYDSSSMVTSVTDGQGKLIESHTYDSMHRGLTSQRANNTDQVTLTYPSLGQTQLSDSMGNATTYGYQNIGGRNFVNSTTGPGCSSCGGRGNTTLSFDSLGNAVSSTDALGRTASYTYDVNGNVLTRSIQLNPTTTLTSSFTYNQFQEVLTATDPLGNATTNTYDVNGNLLSTTAPPPASGQSGLTTSFTYDSKGQLTQVIDPRGNKTSISYTLAGLIASTTDAQGNITSFSYDARGNRTLVTDPLGNKTTFAYDVMNRLTRITQADGSTTSFTYDARGRRTSVTDANGKITSYGYDDADRLLSVTDAAGNLTAYSYDAENHLVSITDALARGTSFSYDSLGRVTQATFPSTLTESYAYDAVGNLLSKQDRKGQTISYVYDNLDRLATKTYPDSTSVTYTYDVLSRLTQLADPTGTYSFAYDNLGRLTQTTTNYSFLSRSLVTSYSYDAGSNRVSLTNPQGDVTNYAYDSLNRLTSLTDFAGRVFSFSYDALGRRTALTRPNGVNSFYNYDPLSRLLSVMHQAGSATLDGVAYAYDAAGNRTAKTVLPANLTYTYNYDPVYQLSQVTRTSDAKITEKYTYDAVGNRLTSPGAPYTYNSSNEMTSREGVPYTYDANGNTLSKTNGAGTTSYTWDFENRLTSVTLPSGGVVSFKYDPFGRRVFKNSPTGTTIYVYDRDNINEELDGSGNLGERYTHGPGIDEPLVGQRQPLIFYYEADGLGSVTSLTTPAGSIAATYTYDSFGFLTNSTGSATNWFRYTARQFDSSTALYYYRARYYDPTTGRFLTEDPLRFDGGNDFYVYALDNPVNFIDPWGLRLCRISLPGIGDTFLDDSFVPLVKKWTTLNGSSGIDVSFTEAFRSTAYQAGLASNPNAITPAPPGSSLHEAGFAVDISWSRIPQDLEPVVVANAQLAGLNWGGYFRKPDRVHFFNDPGGRKQLIKKAQEEFKRGITCKCSL